MNCKKGKLLLKGITGSTGVTVGKVRIISGNDFSQFKTGEILVGNKFIPDHDVWLRQSAAIISNTGGYEDHAMMISRDNGIPGLAGVVSLGEDAMTVLQNDQVVVVEAQSGYEIETDPETGEQRKKWWGGVYECIPSAEGTGIAPPAVAKTTHATPPLTGAGAPSSMSALQAKYAKFGLKLTGK